jgi:hypothetical protein
VTPRADTLGARVAAYFVASPEAARPVTSGARWGGRSMTGAERTRGRARLATGGRAVAVLGPAGAGAFACELAVALARRVRAPAAVVCRHGAPVPALALPAAPAARRLAGRLGVQGLSAQARGRVVVVALPGDDAAAAAAASRAAAAAGDAPVVLALGGARGAALEALLDGQDLCVVTSRPGAQPALAALARAGLEARLGPGAVCATEVAPRPFGPLATAAGTRGRGGAVAAVLGALG